MCNSLFLVGRAGIEPATNGLRAETADCLIFIYQCLASSAMFAWQPQNAY